MSKNDFYYKKTLKYLRMDSEIKYYVGSYTCELKNTKIFKERIKILKMVPMDIRLEVAIELKDAKLCLWVIDNDPDLEFINTHSKRTRENYHHLNNIIDC